MKRSKPLRTDHVTMRTILTVALMGFGATTCRIEEASAVPSVASTGHYGISPSVGLQLPRERCAQSGGVWHSRLVRCDCTEGEVFVVDRGCTNLANTPWLILNEVDPDCLEGQANVVQQQRGLFDVTVHFETMTASERGAIARIWSTVPSALLRGLTLPGTEAAAMLQVHVQRPLNGNHLTLVSEMPMHEGIEMAMHEVNIDPSEILEVFPANEAEALAWDDKEMAAAAMRLRADMPATDSSFWETGPQCNPSCGIVSWDAPDSDGSPGVIHVTEMVKFVPVARILARYGPDGALEAPLSPLGYPAHISWTKHRFSSGDADPRVILSDFRLVDGRTASPIAWNRPIPEDRGSLRFDDVDAAFRVLRANQSRVSATDINVAVIERGVDLRGGRLAAAIAVEQGKLFSDVIAGDSGASRPTENAMSNVESLFNTTSSHGTDVAQTVLGDADGLRMHVLGSSPIFWADDVERLGREYAQWITEKDIRVVVSAVHQSFSISEQRCAAFYHELFSGAEKTLFILSAGNSGLKDFAGCPLGHAREYENVLVVAGADPSGDLNAASNYGVDTVDLAAPWCAEGQRFCGTSHAAPWVGNLAARYLQRYPQAVPARTISALYTSCISSHWVEVGCGGVVDPAAFMLLGRLGREQ